MTEQLGLSYDEPTDAAPEPPPVVVDPVTAATEAGIEQAEIRLGSTRGQLFKESAIAAILTLAKRGGFFTADDVWKLLGGEYEGEFGSQMGPVFRTAQRLGYVVHDGYKESIRPTRHRSPIRVWRSLVDGQ